LSSLREKLKALEELQSIDLEMNGVRGEADGLPARRAALETAVAEARKAWQSERERLEGNERERRQIESLLAMERDKVKKWEGRLGDIKTPREYAALSREIDISKKANETQNEQLKQLAAAAEDIRKAVDSRGDQLSEREMAATDELAAIEKRASELSSRMAELEARRADAAKRVEPTLLGKYENIKRRRAGIAVAPVVAGSCRGCNRNIPPQLSIVLHRVDSIETCPNCHRIIYSADAVNPPAPSPA
jgi:predicted  nucleic acid-binding Zn-ribbon protein